MIELDRVGVDWPGAPGVLSDISLTLCAGEKLVVLGANGCGKSTLLQLLNGLVFPARGTLAYRGIGLTAARLRDTAFARRFRQEVVLLFQDPGAMLFNPTVRDEIAYGPRTLGLPDVDARVAHWAAQLQLEALLEQAPWTLSGGQKQKVALAAILALEPKLILLDEPTANLDPRTAGWLLEFLTATEAAVVATTHHLTAAEELGSRCLVLGADGRIAFDGATKEALADRALLEATGLAYRRRVRTA